MLQKKVAVKNVEKPPENTEEYRKKCFNALWSAQLKVGTEIRIKHEKLDDDLLKQVVETAMKCSGDMKDNLARAYVDYFMRKNGYTQWMDKAGDLEDKMRTRLRKCG